MSLSRDQKVRQFNQRLTVSSCVLETVPEWTLWCWCSPPLSRPENRWRNKGNDLDRKQFESHSHCWKRHQRSIYVYIIVMAAMVWPILYTHSSRENEHTHTVLKWPHLKRSMLQKCKKKLTKPDLLLHQNTLSTARHLLRNKTFTNYTAASLANYITGVNTFLHYPKELSTVTVEL